MAGLKRAVRVGYAAVAFLVLPAAVSAAGPVRGAFGADIVRNVCTETPPTDSAPSAGGVPTAALTVDRASRIVLIEYEAWFGPKTGVYPQRAVTTCLQSSDMQSGGGGYDSTSPAVIAQHAVWLQQMGIDAATVDLTNNVSCVYDGDNPGIIRQVCPAPAFRRSNQQIRDNDMGLYAAWSQLATPLKIVPLLGGFDRYAVTPDPDDPQHRSALEKEADDFGARMAAYPNLSVLYAGKPLQLIYLGTPVDPNRFASIRALLASTGLDRRFTFRLVGGDLDSQPAFWAKPQQVPSGPIEIAPRYGFWSIVDRLNFWGAPPAPYYPTFNSLGDGVENMTASLATAGQSGWLCGMPGGRTYCPDAALRYCGEGYQNGCEPGDYQTLAEFMSYARALRPVFLLVDQLNEFATPDEGPTAESNDDAEPTRQWGYSGLRALIREMRAYRASRATASTSTRAPSGSIATATVERAGATPSAKRSP